jgi:hypothetical protein
MNREPWYESEDPSRLARSGGWRLGVIIVVVIVFFSLISAALWAAGVGFAGIQGKGEAHKQKESANNRIAAQERFQDLYNEILAADKRIDVYADALKRTPDSVIAQTNLTGAITYCTGVVADYDAAARKYTQKDFRDYDLPEKIDPADPATDCKEITEVSEDSWLRRGRSGGAPVPRVRRILLQ